jgi:hypothetical protein
MSLRVGVGAVLVTVVVAASAVVVGSPAALAAAPATPAAVSSQAGYGVLDDASPALDAAWQGTWSSVSSPASWGGSEHVTSDPGAELFVPFTGSTIGLLHRVGPDLGTGTVYLTTSDGSQVCTQDAGFSDLTEHAAANQYQQQWLYHLSDTACTRSWNPSQEHLLLVVPDYSDVGIGKISVDAILLDPATSTTTITAAAASTPSGPGATLRAVVSPAQAGTVQFFDAGRAIGAAVAVQPVGTASLTTRLAVGSHALTAVFTPGGPTVAAPSTSAPLAFVMPGLSLSIAYSLPGPFPDYTDIALTLTAKVTPSQVGTVSFFNGATRLGTSALAADGTASMTLNPPTAGPYRFSATFNPGLPATTGPAVDAKLYPGVTVTAAPVTPAQAAQAVACATGPTCPREAYTASVNPPTAGRIDFLICGTPGLPSALISATGPNAGIAHVSVPLAVALNCGGPSTLPSPMNAIFVPADPTTVSGALSPAAYVPVQSPNRSRTQRPALPPHVATTAERVTTTGR